MYDYDIENKEMGITFKFWPKSFSFTGHHKNWWLSRPVDDSYGKEVVEIALFFYDLGKQHKSDEIRKSLGLDY